MATGLKDKLELAKATSLATTARPTTVISIFQDDRLKSQIGAALPEGTGLTLVRLLSLALNECRRNPELLECTRDSMVGALLQAARLGLEIGGPLGHFHLVPFRNSKLGPNVKEVTPILGYKGMIVLARRSGEIRSIGARAVYAKDYFDFSYGLEDRLEHRPSMEEDRGAIVSFYGVARFTNGGVQPLVLSKAQVDSFRNRSKAAASGSGPWGTDYEAMGAKTVIRRMSPFLPLTVEAATAIAEDEEREEGRTPEMATIDLSDFGIGDGAGDAGAGKPRGKPAATPASPASAEAPKSEPSAQTSEATTGVAPEGAPAAEVTQGTSSPAAEVSPVPPATCEICGAVEDAEGHLKHDDAKHAAVAKARRDAKKQAGPELFEGPQAE